MLVRVNRYFFEQKFEVVTRGPYGEQTGSLSRYFGNRCGKMQRFANMLRKESSNNDLLAHFITLLGVPRLK